MSTNKRAMAVINRDDSSFQHILAHHSNPDAFPLNDRQQEIVIRWRAIFAMQLRGHNRMYIVKMLENDGLSTSQAYADFKNVESLFGNVLKADKEYQRVLWLARAEEDYLRAKQKGKDELAAKIHADIAKYNGLDKVDDQASFNAEKLENNTLELSFGKETVELMKNFATNGKSNVVNFNSLNVTDIGHTELPADEES